MIGRLLLVAVLWSVILFVVLWAGRRRALRRLEERDWLAEGFEQEWPAAGMTGRASSPRRVTR